MATNTPYRHGERWWEHDADESSKSEARAVGLRLYASYLVVVGSVSVSVLFFTARPCTVTAADFASGAVSPPILVTFRVISALVCILTLVRRTFTEAQQDEETLDRRPIRMLSLGPWRYQGLTQWQFLLITIYFTLSSVLTIRAATAPPGSVWVSAPSDIACATSTIFSVAFALALLTTTIVTFVLIPAKVKNGTSASHFFVWNEVRGS